MNFDEFYGCGVWLARTDEILVKMRITLR